MKLFKKNKADGTEVTVKMSKKKKLLICALAAVLVLVAVQIVPTFFGGVSETDFADGGASTTLPVPDGDPSGQTAEDNIYICIGVMNSAVYRSETTGQTATSVGFIDYNQQIYGERIVTKDSVFNQTVSTSALVKVGEQKYFKDGAILIRKADSVSGKTADWSDNIYAVSQEDFARAYGQLPRNLTNYVVSEDTVIDPLMTANADGTYTLTFDLEPEGASAYYKRQIYTYSGASEMPVFTEVHMEWTLDENWRLLRMDTVETYEVTMKGLGTMSCTSKIAEVFSDFDNVTDEQKEFQKYLATKYDPDKLSGIERDDAVQDELLAVFENTPNLNVTLTANGRQYELKAHIDIEAMSFQVKGKVEGLNVFGAYSDGKLYLHVENQKIVLGASDVLDAANKVMSTLGMSMPDISLEGETVQGIVNGMDITSTKSGKTISFNDSLLSGTVKIKGKTTPKLSSADLSLTLGGISMRLSATPAKSFDGESLSGYTDLTGALSLIDPIMNTVNAKGCTADVTLSYGGVSINGRLQVSGVGGNLSCAFVTDIDGVALTVKLINGTAYAEAGNIRIKGTLSEIEELVGLVTELSGSSGGDTVGAAIESFFADLSVKKAINSVSGLSWYGGALHGSLNMGSSVSINAAIAPSWIYAELGDLKLTMSLVSASTPSIAVPQGDFVTLSQLAPFTDTLLRYVGASGMEMTAQLTVGGIAIDADMIFDFASPTAVKASSKLLGTELCVTLYDGEVYVSYGAIRVKASEAELRQTMENVLRLVPSLGSGTIGKTVNAYVAFFDNLSLANVVGAIDEFYYADGALKITAHIAEDPIYISLTPDVISASTNIGSIKLGAVLSPGAALSSPSVLAPSGYYMSLDELLILCNK